jgi:hypothetical protein
MYTPIIELKDVTMKFKMSAGNYLDMPPKLIHSKVETMYL